ncbi:MAG TPA: hypothetical protein VF508_05550, partial [Pyrinomonadaceae bacterium]
MAADEDTRRDTAEARGEAAEESAAAQASHWHSRMEVEEPARDEGATPGRDEGGAAQTGARGSRVRAQPPEEFTGGEFRGASEVSGGLAAVWSSMKHIAREAGVVR